MPEPLVRYDPPTISFVHRGKLLASEPLAALEAVYLITCFNPEVAPRYNEEFDLLQFERTFWVVPDTSARRFIAHDWAEHLASRGGLLSGHSGELPPSWRRRAWLSLMLLKHPYFAKTTVVPIESLDFIRLGERVVPGRYAEYLYERIMAAV
jgi:hypothetical protein